MMAANVFGAARPARAAVLTEKPGMPRLCAVWLIDRRTGSAHRVNGTPLVIYTRDPDEASADLLRNRDPKVWEARIEPFGQGRAG